MGYLFYIRRCECSKDGNSIKLPEKMSALEQKYLDRNIRRIAPDRECLVRSLCCYVILVGSKTIAKKKDEG